MNENGVISDPSSEASSLKKEITDFIDGIRFKKKFFGGVDETDVWKKIRELNALYEKLLISVKTREAGCSTEKEDE